MKFRYIVIFIVFFAGSVTAQYALQDAFPNLPLFTAPTHAILIPDGTNRMLVLEQHGSVWLFNPSNPMKTRLFWDGTKVVSPNGCETGLLGCAFHPDFANNHFIFLSYTTGSSPQWTSHIVRYECTANKPDSIIPSSAHDILTFSQPTGLCNHKGGCLQFGPDGYLYASFGDGGAGGDPSGNGQNRSVLLGKILRLDVDHEADGNHYAIPANNPFAANTQGFRKEIYSYGMRNTWKFSFDGTTGKLWAGDVGQDTYEEIDTIINGGNYGWKIMEGFHCYPNGDFNCDSTGMIPPIWEYPHSINSSGASITGGYVYRGTAIAGLVGKYIYADYVAGKIWALTTDNGPVSNQLLIDHTNSSPTISSFVEDQNHELYVVGYDRGKLYKLISTAGVGNVAVNKNFSLVADRTFFDALHPVAEIRFTLPETEQVALSVFNEAGQEVQHFLDRDFESGEHSIRFSSRSLANGMYFIKLAANSGILVEKISVMK